MAFSGGVFSRLYNWVTDRNAGTKILAARMDAEMDGFATGLSQCVLKDGTQTITAHIPMSGFKITGLGNASADADALNRVTADGRYQALDADLTAIAALTSAANKVPYATGSGAWALADFSSAGRALVDDADAAAQLTTLGVSALSSVPQDRLIGRLSSGSGTPEQLTLGAGLAASGTRLDGGQWAQIGSVSPTGAGNGTSIAFTSLDTRYNEFLVACSGLRHNSGGTASPRLSYSTNNGGAYTEWTSPVTGIGVGQVRSGFFLVLNRKTAFPVALAGNFSAANSASALVAAGSNLGIIINDITGTIDALRVDINGSNFFDQGTVTLYGR